ncbi:Omega-amidase, chloroplastic [Orobanche gracilis]
MIGLCQLRVTADKESNILHARSKIEEAAERGAKLVVLPEIWNSPYSNDSFPLYAEDIDAGVDASPSTAMLSEIARLSEITIIGGSIPERSGDKLYNTCCVFGPDGKLKAKHRKVDTEVGRIGIGICYDINFQELAMLYAARARARWCSIDLLSWSIQHDYGGLHTGNYCKEQEATDNQLYVATCSPARDAAAGYVAWGHSTLVGPFGEVLATTEHDEAILISEIDYSQIKLRRL